MSKGNEMDIRLIRLAKWHIPKSKSVLEFCGENTYLSIGYFDMVDVEKVENVSREESEHPLLRAYKASHRYSERVSRENEEFLPENYSMQELIAVMDTSENGFSNSQINGFWEDSSLLLFVSLIHIDSGSNVANVIEKVKQVFKNNTYLFYFSFDYSGIIIFAKNMEFKEYLECIFALNYESADGQKLIRDSYSLYGIDKGQLRKIFDEFQKGYGVPRLPDRVDNFSASINIGIQNYEAYKEFIKELKKEVPGNVEEYGLYGRHDISIVNKAADLRWLLYSLYLLDKYTCRSDEMKETALFSTHETFVKVSGMKTFQDVDPGDGDALFGKAGKKMKDLCDSYFEQLSEKKNQLAGEYKVPVQAVYYSVSSILKNHFAEDFVFCMYESFCAFMEYLTEKLSKDKVNHEDFDVCYSRYFHGLNSLVNSAMHSERQFIQATAFNAIIYDVPSKIMAFYVAVIHDIQQIIRMEGDKKYTFLLTPSFQNEIKVDIISYEEKPPHDRLLMVSINEQSLYDPQKVIWNMVHEIAHYIGDGLRKRDLRKKQLKETLIQFALTRILHKDFFVMEGFDELIDDIGKALPKYPIFLNEENNYSEDLYGRTNGIGEEIAIEFEENDTINKLLHKFVLESLQECFYNDQDDELSAEREGITQYLCMIVRRDMGTSMNLTNMLLEHQTPSKKELDVLANLILSDIRQEILGLRWDEYFLFQAGTIIQSTVAIMREKRREAEGRDTKRVYLGQYTRILLSCCSEAFSDIQMILLMGIRCVEYFMGFLREEKINLDTLPEHAEDLIRISVVTMVLNYLGIWNGVEEIALPEEEMTKLKRFYAIIEGQIRAMERHITKEELKDLKSGESLGKEFWNETGGNKMELNSDSIIQVDPIEDNTFYYANLQLTHYLVACAKSSLEHYMQEDRLAKIRALRELVADVIEGKSITKMFISICAELDKYKKEIFS